MRTTIDKAGRIVLPKALRDQVGITAGEVDVEVVGAELRVSPTCSANLVEEDGILVVPDHGLVLTDELIRQTRLADQR